MMKPAQRRGSQRRTNYFFRYANFEGRRTTKQAQPVGRQPRQLRMTREDDNTEVHPSAL
jgi:hypothetical protein